MRLRPGFVAALALGLAQAAAANPLSFLGGSRTSAAVDAPAEGPIILQPGHPQRLRIGAHAPEREFAKGKSRYRVIELAKPLEHAAVRVEVIAQKNPAGRGNVVFKPVLYVLGDDDAPGAAVEVKPLEIDIRPFRRTRLRGCVPLDKVRRFAVATAAEAVGKSYESEVRKGVKAPTQGGFYYSPDAVKLKLPYAATGTLVLEVSEAKSAGKGC